MSTIILTLPSRTSHDIGAPDSSLIMLSDLAHGLARQRRFNGHTLVPWNVANHSRLVGRIATMLADGDIQCQLAHRLGVVHDAAEAILGDIITPLKDMLPAYRELEAKWQEACERAIYGSTIENHPRVLEKTRPLVKTADQLAFWLEDKLLRPTVQDGYGVSSTSEYYDLLTSLDGWIFEWMMEQAHVSDDESASRWMGAVYGKPDVFSRFVGK